MASNGSSDYTIQILRAIKYISRYDIVHCDIKPSNIIVTRDGVAKLGDFGFVKSNLEIRPAEEGSVLGTPDYIAPEQAMGKKNIDFRADQYALGVTLYHMVTRKVPFDGTVSTIMRKHIKAEAPSVRELNPDVPRGLAQVIDRMMKKDPEERYPEVDEIFKALERVKISESGDGYESADREVLVQEIEASKDEKLRTEFEKLEVSQQLNRWKTLFWILVALFCCSMILNFVLILQQS